MKIESVEIEARLESILELIFLRKIRFNEMLSRENVEEWDSIAQIDLLVAIEEEFKVRFSVGEFETFENLGSLRDYLKINQCSIESLSANQSEFRIAKTSDQ